MQRLQYKVAETKLFFLVTVQHEQCCFKQVVGDSFFVKVADNFDMNKET